MAGSVGISLVRNGLTLALDAGDSQSYPGSGTSWFDLSRNNGTCTLYGSPSYSSSSPGSLSFNGSSQYADILDSSFVNFTTGTVSVWFVCSSAPSSVVVIDRGSSTNSTEGWYVVISGARAVTCGYKDTGTVYNANGGSVTFGRWHNTTFTFSSGGSLSAYFDGNFISNVSIPTVTITPSRIGIIKSVNANFYPNPMSGSISSVHLYNRVLTRQEVSQNFNALRGRFGV